VVVFWYAGPLSFYPPNIRLFLPHSREKDEGNKQDIDVASPPNGRQFRPFKKGRCSLSRELLGIKFYSKTGQEKIIYT